MYNHIYLWVQFRTVMGRNLPLLPAHDLQMHELRSGWMDGYPTCIVLRVGGVIIITASPSRFKAWRAHHCATRDLGERTLMSCTSVHG